MLGLRTTIYHVSDLERAKIWYTKVFEVEPYFDEPFYVGFNIEGYELGLQPDKSGKQEKVTSVVSYWGVLDVPAEYERIIALGGTVHESPRNVGGPIVVAGVKDPWGNIIGLIYNPTFTLQ